MQNKPDLKNFTQPRLKEFISDLGLPGYRAGQIFSWLHRPHVTDFEQMTDIKKELRHDLAAISFISTLVPAIVEISKDGTVKFAFELADGKIIESVLIPEEDRNTLCVSSQVGCAMGCTFCLTATMGFKRNLTTAEIVGQVNAVRDYLLEREGGRITNLVFMGMGEPLANLDNLLPALAILSDVKGLDFSDRRITVSTCGIIPKMKELGEKSRVNLAISLHAADNETRSLLMPINKTYPVDDLLAACREYPLPKRKRIMIEYALIEGVNDSPAAAKLLVKKLHGIPCKINLLSCNETALPYRSPSRTCIDEFFGILYRAGFTTLIRQSRGGDISAACGQLACQADQSRKKV